MIVRDRNALQTAVGLLATNDRSAVSDVGAVDGPIMDKAEHGGGATECRDDVLVIAELIVGFGERSHQGFWVAANGEAASQVF